MANLCEFQMKVIGKTKEDIEKFYKYLSQDGNTYMGRGAGAIIDEIKKDDNKFVALISGDCKWSITASLVSNAISMREEPKIWSFGDTDSSLLRFITLFEACKELGLDVEVYSSEPGCCFQEHIICKHGKVVVDDCVDYFEDYDEETDEITSTGGYSSWDFEI